MQAQIAVFIFWTGNTVTVTVHRDGWQYSVLATEEQIPSLTDIIPEIAQAIAAARVDWFQNNRDSTDPDLLRPDEVSGNAQLTVGITDKQLRRLETFKQGRPGDMVPSAIEATVAISSEQDGVYCLKVDARRSGKDNAIFEANTRERVEQFIAVLPQIAQDVETIDMACYAAVDRGDPEGYADGTTTRNIMMTEEQVAQLAAIS